VNYEDVGEQTQMKMQGLKMKVRNDKDEWLGLEWRCWSLGEWIKSNESLLVGVYIQIVFGGENELRIFVDEMW